MLDLVDVVSEDLFATADIRQRNMNDFVKAARTLYGRVNSLLKVGRSNNDNVIRWLEPVHLGEQLVYGVATV